MNYKTYHTDQIDGTAHGGTAIIINEKINRHEVEECKKEHLQATNIVIN